MEPKAFKVKSADRVLDIFELFTGGVESYNLSEISKKLNMPPSSTYLLLQNMLERGYLEADKTGNSFESATSSSPFATDILKARV